MKSIKLLFLVALSVLILLPFVNPTFAAFGDAHGQRPSCEVCGMYIDEFHDTSAQLTMKDGQIMDACGVACMLRLINDRGGPDAFTRLTVHDWQTKSVVPAGNATYVIGSKIIPDMMPNIIAFGTKEDAEAFKAKEGGELLDLTQALLSISPMGMTMPTRIKTAVISPKGALGAGAGYMHMVMDKVKVGSAIVDPLNFVSRPGQMMAPKKMTSDAEMLMINYSLTDDLSMGVTGTYFEKEMQSYKKGGAITEKTRNDGFGDVDMTFRYGLWKNSYYSKFFSLLAGTTLPTGEFEKQFITMPGLQTGAGAFSFTGGLLYSQRYKDIWLHSLASYTAGLENGDDYKFGDTKRLGVALHYTPNYDIMTGLELDATYFDKDKYNGDWQNSTGGFRSNVTAVAEWRFLTALGGNFSIRGTGGLPLYENLNHYNVGPSEKVKLGSGYFANAMINFSRRFPMY